jgi:CheY-like chemotaxis protein
MTSAANEIFYVDDSPDDLLLVNYQMRSGSFDIVLKTFSTGIAVMMDMERRLARAERLPALVVADFYMPVVDGPELFRLIRANGRFDTVRLASCSGGDDPNDKQSARQAGAEFFLDKPLNLALCQEILAGTRA